MSRDAWSIRVAPLFLSRRASLTDERIAPCSPLPPENSAPRHPLKLEKSPKDLPGNAPLHPCPPSLGCESLTEDQFRQRIRAASHAFQGFRAFSSERYKKGCAFWKGVASFHAPPVQISFLGSSVVERSAVNRLVVGSNPTPGASPCKVVILSICQTIAPKT